MSKANKHNGKPRGWRHTAARQGHKSSAKKREIDHVSISILQSGKLELVLLSTIRPSPLNDQLYKPVDPKDPEIKALARSIIEHGLQEPIVITSDNYIVSGHRRYVACVLADLKTVPCRRIAIHSSDTRFLTLLRECNRQRVKSIDEVVREEVVSADPEESYRLLREHREKNSQVDAEAITIFGEKRRARITEAKLPFLNAILKVLKDRRNFWPLTDRLVHYALLNDPPLIHASKPDSLYQNIVQHYKATCELITRARLTGQIPWGAIHDPTRPLVTWDVHREPATFIRKQLDSFLKGFYRDLMQSQPNHIEVVGEKNTIESIVRPVAMEYTIPYTIGRGYSSLSPRYEMAQRFRKSGKEQLILLVASDFDPEGEDIPHSFARSMRDDFGIEKVHAIKVALTADQVMEMQLPPQMKAKEKSSRYGKFVALHGEDVFELEAVEPGQFQALLREAIDSVLDLDAFNREIDLEKANAAKLDGIRRGVLANIGDLLSY